MWRYARYIRGRLSNRSVSDIFYHASGRWSLGSDRSLAPRLHGLPLLCCYLFRCGCSYRHGSLLRPTATATAIPGGRSTEQGHGAGAGDRLQPACQCPATSRSDRRQQSARQRNLRLRHSCVCCNLANRLSPAFVTSLCCTIAL